MLAFLRLLSGIFVKAFYRINAGFFLFFFLLFFGVVNPSSILSYHKSIIDGILASPVLLAVAVAVWALYQVKCVNFFSRMLGQEANSFLVNLQCLPAGTRLLLLGIIHIINFIPVGIYIITVLIIGFKGGNEAHAFVILAALILFCMSGAYLYNRQIMRWPFSEKTRRLFINIPALNVPKTYIFLLVHYTFYERKLALLIIKIFSIGLLLITDMLGEGTFYIENFLLFFMIIVLAHAILVYSYVQEMETKMSFLRNLPIAIVKRAAVYLCAYLVLMIPEIVFLITNFSKDISWWVLVVFYLTAVSQLLLFTSVLYLPRVTMKRYIQIIVAIFLVSETFLRLPSIYIFLAAQILISILIFQIFYYKYERIK